MTRKLKILHLEDLASDANLVDRALKKGDLVFEKLLVTKKTDYQNALEEFAPDIVLSDHSLPSFNSIEALKLLKESGIDAPFILVTATVSEEFAVTVIQQGGDDYVLKSNLSRLPSAITSAMDRRFARQEKIRAERELKIAHDTLLFHLENSPLGYIEWDNKLSIRSMSARAEEIFGWTMQEFNERQMNGLQLVYKADLERIDEVSAQLVNGTVKNNKVVNRNHTKDGRLIWCEWFNSVLKNEDDEVMTIMSLVEDVTERKLAEENLRYTLREIADYKYALDESSIVAITDQKGTILHVNDNFCNISKYKREELLGQDHRIINSGYHSKEFIRNQWQTIARGRVWKGEFKNRAKDGSYYWVDSIIVPFLNEQGKPNRYVAIRTDITERKNAEQALINNELRFREFFETAPEALFVIDASSKTFVDHNDNALKLLKCPGDVLHTRSPQDFSPPFQPGGKSSHDKINELFTLAINGGHPIFEWVFRDTTGHDIFCEVRLNLLTNNTRPLVRASVLDITERKELEKSLLEEKVKRQQEITDAVITTQEKERTFLGEELHDNINQILATSMLYMDLAINSDTVRKDIMIDSRNYLFIAVEEIRKLSKSLLPPSLGDTSLREVLDELVSNVQQVNKISFNIDWAVIDESLLDEKQSLAIFRIVQEQLNNIFKYARASMVTISLEQKEGALVLKIRDDGVGFDTSVKRKGIGLKNIISRSQLVNGVVQILSNPGEGCELSVHFATA